jgi:hypothetical protein
LPGRSDWQRRRNHTRASSRVVFEKWRTGKGKAAPRKNLAKQAKELSELRSELARLEQIMGTVREALRCIDTYSYKGEMTRDAEKKAHAQLAEFMTKGF